MISLKLQPQCVGIGREVGRTLCAREPPDDEGVVRLAIFDRQSIIGGLKVEVIKCQVDSGARI